MAKPPREHVHQPIQSRRVPRRAGVGSQAVRVEAPGEQLHVGLQLPLQPPAGKLAGGDGKAQIDVCLANLVTLLKDADFMPEHVVQLRAYLLDLADEPALNAAVGKYFVGGSYPAISVVKVAGLPLEAAAGIEAVAVKPAPEEAY